MAEIARRNNFCGNIHRVVDSDNFERDDIQASLSFEEIASHLPYNFVNERRA